MSRTWMFGLVFMLGAAVGTSSSGAILGEWALTADGAGTSAESGKVTVGDFVGGSGINEITFGSSGAWATGWTANSSPDLTDYFEVSIAPLSDFGLVVSEIAYSERRSKAGPLTYQVRWSTNNFVSYTVLLTETLPDNDSERTHSIPNLSISIPEGRTFKVRFYAYQVEDSGGTWRINANSLKILGTAMSLTGPPVVGFVPGSGVQVHVSNTLEVAVSVLPTGTITDWWLDPVPGGSYNLAGSTFTFTPVAADDGGTHTLSVVASNAYGMSTGTLDIAVTEYLPPGTMEITFENDGEIKSSYDPGPVTLSGEVWIMDQARVGDEANDVKLGSRAARFGSLYPAFMTSSNKLLPAGIGTISFLYAKYSTSTDGAELVVEVATDAEAGPWLEVGRVDANGVTELTSYQTAVGVNEPMYVRFRNEYVSGIGQVNVDNIIITPYQTPSYSDYEVFLLQYNVTPGDPGTAPDEDWDGDGYSNTNEFDNLTNPYDADHHP